ncbi:MAG TPA: PAC2 family protein [Propionibacteriaceae bacterium]|nr:PAC2 family protein [Propionibacteriaceae bacterium]
MTGTEDTHPQGNAGLRGLHDPVVVMAFEGWNDAGSSASAVVEHLADIYDAELAFSIDPDDFYDFQVNRPHVTLDEDGRSEITWPTTEVRTAKLPDGRDLLLVQGLEPNLRWRPFCQLLVSALISADARRVVVLGALLADTPHTRPVPVSVSSRDEALNAEFGLEQSSYEGPTGIIGVLADALTRAGIQAFSVWAAVPHYVSHPPCPKATLALLSRIEDLVSAQFELGDLPELSRAWERGVNELAAEDSEVAEYVTALEEQQDAAELPEASGDAIAAEFERYLRRRNES